MPTHLGWNVVTIPSVPWPATVEFSVVDIVSGNASPFSGQMQTYDWNASYMEASIQMPPMVDSDAQAWITFLRALKGISGVFQFTSGFAAQYPASIGSRYWRLKSNVRKWSIKQGSVYGFQFEVREAI